MALQIIELRAVGSTNDEALRRARAGAPLPLCIRAMKQHAGRGRRARAWASPIGGVWMSVAGTIPDASEGAVPPTLNGSIAMRAAVAALLAIGPELTSDDDHRLEIKWPNDILLDRRKVAGVLCERYTLGTGEACLILGVGINANFERSRLPADVRTPATTLRTTLGREIECGALADRLADRLVSVVEHSARPLSDSEIRFVLGRLAYLDEHVTMARPDGSVVDGVLAGLTPDGSAAVRTGSSLRIISAGDLDLR